MVKRKFKRATAFFICIAIIGIVFISTPLTAQAAWVDMGSCIYDNSIQALAVSADGTIYAAGFYGYFARWNGSSWVEMGQWPHGSTHIRALVANGNTIWAAGDGGYTAYWNGSNWVDMGQWLHEYVGINALVKVGNTIWAAGVEGHTAYWNGSNWVDMGRWDHYPNHIYAMDVAGDVIWVAGERGCTSYWDGTTWINTGQWPNATTSDEILSVVIDSSGTAWVAGSQGRISYWNGSSWVDMGQWPHGPKDINALIIVDSTIWAAGGGGYTAYWDGSSWVDMGQWPHGGKINALAKSGNTIWAAGGGGKTAAITIDIVTPPDIPQSTQLSVTLQGSDATLSWTPSTLATSYILERSTDGINYNQITETTQLNYTDTGLAPGDYYYRVKAKNSAGVSDPSNVVSVYVSIPSSMFVYWNGNNVVCEWNRGDTQIQGDYFELWRMDSITNKWISVWLINNIDAFTWNDTWVSPGINYKYAIWSRGIWYEWQTVAESDWATGDRPLPAPGGLRVILTTDNSATISWTAISGATEYQINVSTDGGTSWGKTTVSGTTATVPRPCMVQVMAGTHARSQWSGILRVQ